jgi:hypothetical protein
VATFVKIETVGGEGVTKGADRPPFVVIAAQGPLRLVPVSLMGTQVNHPAGFEGLVYDAQDAGIAESSVTDDVFDVEGGIARAELEELGRKRNFLTSVGGREVIKQDEVEAAGGISEEEWQAGISIARLAFFRITLLIICVRLVGAAIADEARLRVAWGGSTAD